MKFLSLLSIALLLLCASSRLVASTDPDAASVVILANGSDADSVAIAEYYAKQRGIPLDNIIALEMPTKETITLQQYVETISNPLLNALLEKEWISGVKASQPDRYGRQRLSVAIHRIRYLVTVRGVPLRFSNAPELIETDTENIPQGYLFNRASVDSELSLLPAPPGLSMTAFLPNPFFGGKPVAESDANRVIKVSRLDGPSKLDVIQLVDRTLEAEEKGLMGRAYIDTGGPHPQGDEWLNAAGELLKGAFFDTEFESTKRPRGFADRLDAPAIYMGWYRPHAYGPWREARWSVPPGAIGYHLHSFSATTVRSVTKAWIGSFVAQGYCATFGYTYEPYLQFTVHPHVFLEYLMDGGSFGDAISVGNPALSWQTVAVGDPLYRPFKKGLDEQLEDSMEGPYAAYVGLREMNRIEAISGEEEALTYARTLFLKHPSLAIVYRLAEAFEKAGKIKEAVEVLKVVRFISTFSRDENALVQRIADMLHEHGESQMAFEIYQNLLGERKMPKDLRIALLDGGSPIATAVGKAALSSRWNLESQTLKAPIEPKK